jgi:hypothetical protein
VDKGVFDEIAQRESDRVEVAAHAHGCRLHDDAPPPQSGTPARGLLPHDEAQAMAQWAHDGGFSVDGSVRIAAADRAGRERLDRRRSQYDPLQTLAFLLSSRSEVLRECAFQLVVTTK